MSEDDRTLVDFLIHFRGQPWHVESRANRHMVLSAGGELVCELSGMDGKVKNQPPDLTAGEFNRGE